LIHSQITARILIGAALLCVAILYFYRLNAQDAYLSIEEVQHARQAVSLASSGRSIMGQSWPLYFSQPDFLPGRDPLWVYIGAGVLKLAPFSEGIVRTPSAVAGVASVVIMFFVARRIFARTWLAVAAAALLAFSPAHFIHSRIATSQIALVFFVLAWLLFVLRYIDTGRLRDLCMAMASLTAGVYAYLPALIMMPIYLVLTAVAVARTSEHLPRTHIAAAGATVAAMLIPWMAWHAFHPERFQQLAEYYSANGYNRVEASVFTLSGLLSRGDYWWNAFNPGLLFLSGDNNIRFSTRNVGCFLLPVAPLAAIALIQSLSEVRREARLLVFVGLVLAPLPAVTAADFEIKRWLGVVPFAILAATAGLAAIAAGGRRPRAIALAVIIAIGAIQFVRFLADYHGDYRARAVPWFGGNMRAAIVAVMKTTQDARCALLDVRLYPDYWPLYTTVNHRPDLAAETHIVDVAASDFTPPRGCRTTQLIVSEELVREHSGVRARLAPPHWTAESMPEPGGRTYLLVLRYHDP
jgi:4-amino-4-deoxy-L-arabinose transferase-like glycosyltransferase